MNLGRGKKLKLNFKPSQSFFSGGSSSPIKNIINRSNRAVCGAFEREVTVPRAKVNSTIKTLRSKGFMIVGTDSVRGFGSVKIWFAPLGATGL